MQYSDSLTSVFIKSTYLSDNESKFNKLQHPYKTMECLQSFFITLINSGIFEYFAEYFSDFLLKDLFNILLCDGCVIWKEFIYPVSVICNLFIAADILSCQDVIFQKFHLSF